MATTDDDREAADADVEPGAAEVRRVGARIRLKTAVRERPAARCSKLRHLAV